MNPELAVLYAKLDIYHEAMLQIMSRYGGIDPYFIAQNALTKATKLSQPASQPEKP